MLYGQLELAFGVCEKEQREAEFLLQAFPQGYKKDELFKKIENAQREYHENVTVNDLVGIQRKYQSRGAEKSMSRRDFFKVHVAEESQKAYDQNTHTLQNVSRKMKRLDSLYVIPCRPSSAATQEKQSHTMPVRTLLFFIIDETFRNLRGFTIKWDILVLLLIEGYWLLRKLSFWSGREPLELYFLTSISIAKIAGFLNLIMFLKSSYIHFERLQCLLNAHMLMVVPKDAWDQNSHILDFSRKHKFVKDIIPEIDVYHLQSILGWSHSFAILREYGKPFTQRFHFCLALIFAYTLLAIISTTVFLSSLTLNSIVGQQLIFFCAFPMLTFVASMNALYQISGINMLQQSEYGDVVEWLQMRISMLQYSLKLERNDQQPTDMHAALGSLLQEYGQDKDALVVQLRLIVSALEDARSSIEGHHLIKLFGMSVTRNFLKNIVTAGVSFLTIIVQYLKSLRLCQD